jgi:streptogramin lyase
MKFHTSRKSLKKLSILALALLPLGYATAASAEPVYQNPIALTGDEPSGLTINPAGNPLATIWNNNDTGYTQEIIDNIAQPATLIHTSVVNTVFDSSGNEWISNWATNTVTEYVGGVAQTPIQIPGANFAWGLAFDASGNLWVTDFGNKLTEIINGVVQTPIPVQNSPMGVAVGQNGNVWVGALSGAQQIQEVVNGVAHTPIQLSIVPVGVAVDGNGNIWAVDGNSGSLQEIINGVPQPVISNPNAVFSFGNGYDYDYVSLAIDSFGNIWIDGGFRYSGPGPFIQKITGAVYPTATGPDTVSNLAVATVGHTALKLTWGSSNASDTQYVCTASNGASVTVSGNSCLLKGFDLYHSGNYTVSVTAVNSQGQSDPVTLNVQL